MAGLKLEYEKCSPLVVKQMSMLPEFVDGVKITSVMAPFYCEESDSEELVAIKLEGVTYDQVEKLVRGIKGKNGDNLEFDEPIASYFFFLKK